MLQIIIIIIRHMNEYIVGISNNTPFYYNNETINKNQYYPIEELRGSAL
jgi:hypothetical protein